MAIHELGTNSMKYGAIGREEGRISVTWDKTPNGGCLLTWTETGIEAHDTPDSTGYGTMLLTTLIPRQLEGSAAQRFETDRFTYTLEIGSGEPSAPPDA